MPFRLTSSDFQAGAAMPTRLGCCGEDCSPALEWGEPPEGTRSFALVCHDPDAPGGDFRHWAIFDIPAERQRLPKGIAPLATTPDGCRQAVNDFGRPGYAGPCPPRGHGVHHYHFRLFALGIERLDLPERAGCARVAEAARPHALATAELVGLFER